MGSCGFAHTIPAVSPEKSRIIAQVQPPAFPGSLGLRTSHHVYMGTTCHSPAIDLGAHNQKEGLVGPDPLDYYSMFVTVCFVDNVAEGDVG
jgi:hypothetical protein